MKEYEIIIKIPGKYKNDKSLLKIYFLWWKIILCDNVKLEYSKNFLDSSSLGRKREVK